MNKRPPLTEEQKTRKREREKLWRAKNKDKVLEKNKRFSEKNPTYFFDYYKDNREKCLAASIDYGNKHADEMRSRAKVSYLKRKSLGLPVRGESKEGSRIRNINRRSLKQNGGNRLPKGFFTKLMGKQKNSCAGCGNSISSGFHADHIYPLSKGGKHSIDNIQLLCPKCNMSKHAKDPIDWRNSIGQLL